MSRIDLSLPTFRLIGPVLRANWQPVLSTSFFMTLATLGPDLIEIPADVAEPEAVDLAAAVVLVLVWMLAETSIAFAVFPTLMTGGILHGYHALRRAALPRMAAFVGMQFFLLALTIFFAALVPFCAWALGVASMGQILEASVYPVFTTASLLALFLFGLTLPDIVLTGRLSLGSALRWMARHPRALGMGLVLWAGPVWWASDVLAGILPPSSSAILEDGGIEAVQHVMLTWASVILSILGSVCAAIALAKVYRAELPPEAVLEAGRVSEVFD